MTLKEGDTGKIHGVEYEVTNDFGSAYTNPIRVSPTSKNALSTYTTLYLTLDGKLHPDSDTVVWEPVPQLPKEIFVNVYPTGLGVAHESAVVARKAAEYTPNSLRAAIRYVRQED